MYPICIQYVSYMYPICILYVPYMYPLCIQYVSKTDPKVIPKWSKNGPKIVQNWSQSDPKMVQKWSKSDPKEVKWSLLGSSGGILGSIPIFQHRCQKWIWKHRIFAQWTQKSIKNWWVFEGQTHFDCKKPVGSKPGHAPGIPSRIRSGSRSEDSGDLLENY